ncbi:carbamoyl-phosphate synthase large subunit [Natronospora cellulosivora (SeqCode)]
MPKREDISKVLIIGSGPIVIGQACEFDYSGTQACKALTEEGYEIVLVNSNPATIMTDPEMADRTYIEPLTVESVEKIIEIEKPDALLPNLGGQTALNLASELDKEGILEKHNVEIIGIQPDAIERGEDRIIFKEEMKKLGVPMAKSSPAYSIEEAEEIAKEFTYPVVIRPAYTMGGTGGGIVYNVEELREVVERGIAASMISQVLVEEAVIGWQELELELVRDHTGKKISICFIENVDPMGVHTGDSFCVAPMLTVAQKVQDRIEEYSYKIADAIGVIGGANFQFAYNPEDDRLVVIEMNPRTSRSSALASKATGFPIARISTILAVGYRLDELPYWKEGTLDKYRPSGDYVVVKYARWAFEKFPEVEDKLGTQMMAVGEAMSIGKNFVEAFQKAIRSLEIGRYGLGNINKFKNLKKEEILQAIGTPSSERIFLIYQAMQAGINIKEIQDITYIDEWFLSEMKRLVDFEEKIKGYKGQELPEAILVEAKELGFSDKYLAKILDTDEKKLREQRYQYDKKSDYDIVPVSGADGEYYYSTYNKSDSKVETSDRKKIMILGGGPNRIGQGIEFDYACVHAAFTLDKMDYDSVMVNCNPETVSTDYDTSNKLYFEPLTVEDVLRIYEKEKPEGMIVQFGGQTPLNIAEELEKAGVKILGTSPASIDFAEDREQFRELMVKLDIPQPESDIARSIDEARKIARRIGYPLMVRPSYVLGGRGMEIVYDEASLDRYVQTAVDEVSPDHPILIDKFLENAIEAEVDALTDGKDTFVAAIMEHIEEAGIHSGDSACSIPAINITDEQIATIEDYSEKIAKELEVVGLMNIQYAIADGKVYIIEANPRASRTVPLVSKVTGINMAQIATRLMLGESLVDMNLKTREIPYFGIKEAVFPFNMFKNVDPVLGPEMKATGEVMGIADSYSMAFYKAQEASGVRLPLEGKVLITVNEKDKPLILESAKKLVEMGFEILATGGTHNYLEEQGIKSTPINKINQGRPNIVDAIKNGDIQLIINTPIGKQGKDDDSYIRSGAIQYKIPYITTTTATKASVNGIAAARKEDYSVKAIQDFHQMLEK